jgi:hypothetical protein
LAAWHFPASAAIVKARSFDEVEFLPALTLHFLYDLPHPQVAFRVTLYPRLTFPFKGFWYSFRFHNKHPRLLSFL